MSKFQTGDAVRIRLGHPHVAVEPPRRVVWTHPDGAVTLELISLPAEGETDRIRISEAEVYFADPLLQFFVWGHLKPELREVSEPFGRLAHDLVFLLPDNPQRAVALQHLLEAKDAAVRARLWA